MPSLKLAHFKRLKRQYRVITTNFKKSKNLARGDFESNQASKIVIPKFKKRSNLLLSKMESEI